MQTVLLFMSMLEICSFIFGTETFAQELHLAVLSNTDMVSVLMAAQARHLSNSELQVFSLAHLVSASYFCSVDHKVGYFVRMSVVLSANATFLHQHRSHSYLLHQVHVDFDALLPPVLSALLLHPHSMHLQVGTHVCLPWLCACCLNAPGLLVCPYPNALQYFGIQTLRNAVLDLAMARAKVAPDIAKKHDDRTYFVLNNAVHFALVCVCVAVKSLIATFPRDDIRCCMTT